MYMHMYLSTYMHTCACACICICICTLASISKYILCKQISKYIYRDKHCATKSSSPKCPLSAILLKDGPGHFLDVPNAIQRSLSHLTIDLGNDPIVKNKLWEKMNSYIYIYICFENLLRYIDTLEDKPRYTNLSFQRMSIESPTTPAFVQSKTVGNFPPLPPRAPKTPQTPPPQQGQLRQLQQTAPWVCTSTSHTWHR